MNSRVSPTGLHPLLAIAAICVILFSVVGIAAMLGLLPQANSKPAEAETVAEITPPADTSSPAAPQFTSISPPAEAVAEPAPAPAPVPVAASKPKVVVQEKVVYQERPAPAPAPAQSCWNCGTVASVETVTQAGQASGAGAVGGAVLGGVIGNQFGKGDGKKAMTAVGVIGGALAGNAIEKQQRQSHSYQVNVRMEDGSYQSFNYASVPPFSSGDRVKVQNGELVRAY